MKIIASALTVPTTQTAIKAMSYQRNGGASSVAAGRGGAARRILAVPVLTVVAIGPPPQSSPDVPTEA